MNEESYRKALSALVRLGHEQKNILSEGDYVRLMGPLSMTEEQDALTRAYLKEIRIRFAGEENKDTEAEEEEEREELSGEDGSYLAFYLESLSGIPETSQEEQRSLFTRACAGDPAARKRLMETRLSDVVEIAQLYVTEALSLEDLISEGNIGLMHAVEELSGTKDGRDAEAFLTKRVMDTIDGAIARAQTERKESDELVRKLIENQRKGKQTEDEGGTAGTV